MKRAVVLFVVLAIVLVGAVSYFFNLGEESNQDTTTTPGAFQEDSQPPIEPQEKGLLREVSVSTQEELFQEIRNAVNEHLSE